MDQEKEVERHSKILEQIRKATRKEELPTITPVTFSSFLAANVYFDQRHIRSTEFAEVLPTILKYNFFTSDEVKEVFIRILERNYPGKEDREYLEKYVEMAKNPRIYNLIIEMSERNKKIVELEEKEEFEKHQEMMKQIRSAYEVKELPKVSRASITRYVSDHSKTNYSDKISVSKLQDLVELLMEGYSITDEMVSDALFLVCQGESLSHSSEMHDQIMGQLLPSLKLKYLVEEVREKEKRTSWIYQNDHEEIMGNIKDARRISQLPPNLSLSTITGYLSGNSTIYPKGNKVPSGEFTKIAHLLMAGKRFEDRDMMNELARIILDYYPEKLEEAFTLMIEKLSSLPKVYYYAEEVKLALSKQKEFITRGVSNVNVYFVPNPKSPMDAGKFYNCYLSRAQNLDLQDILPLKLDDIIPPEMDVDSIEWYVQEYHDPTFKKAGGIIINKDETIGNVSIFQPSDGKIGITPEEHSRYQELEDLSKQVKEIIARKKKETSDFVKLQEAFLKSQQATDEELASLEVKIDLLTREGQGRGGRK